MKQLGEHTFYGERKEVITINKREWTKEEEMLLRERWGSP